MKTFFKIIGIASIAAAALVAVNTIIDILYKNSTKYYTAD